MEKNKNLKSFLHLGYFLDYKNPNISFDLTDLPLLKQELSVLDERELQIEAKKIWYNVFDKLYRTGNHLVPLSGGLDSRAILATLLKFTESDKIHTYTFGTPGTYDYDIGNLVAKKIGTKHKSFSFKDYNFSTEKEIDVSKRIDHQTFLFHHPPLDLIDSLYENFQIWSGFMLDWIAGSHRPKELSRNIETAKNKVFRKETFVKSISLIENEDINSNYSYNYLFPNECLSFEEQLEIFNRYPKYIGPNILYNGYDFILPGYSKEMYMFYFALPDNLRHHEVFYKNFLFKEFPSIFQMPLKSLNGLSFHDSKYRKYYRSAKNKAISKINDVYPIYTHPHTNYMDFNEGIRKRKDLNKVVYDNILDLKNRKIVDLIIDVEKIYNDHMKRKRNHADALIVLSSLEIHLKAGKKL